MPDIDYDPVETPDDEEERKRRGYDYAPVSPARSFDVGATPSTPPSASPSPELAVTSAGPIAKRGTIPQIGGEAPQVKQPRPQWSDYAPPEPHGWSKFGHIMAGFSKPFNQYFNVRPEQQAEEKYKNAVSEYEAPAKEEQETAQTAETQARTGKEQAETEALKNPQPKIGNTPEEQFMNDALHGDKGNPKLDAEGKPYTYLTAHRDWMQTAQDVKPDKPTQPPHVTYDQGVPVSVTAGDKTYDINDPKLPPELKPLVDSANRAHGQHVKESAEQQARAFSNQQKMFDERQNAISATTKSMVEAAPKVKSLISRVTSEIDKQINDLGPAASRWNEFMAGKVGAPNPEFTKLRTDVGLLTTLLMRMHVGARGGEKIMEHFHDLIDSSKQSPENLKAALEEIKNYADDVQKEGEAKGVHSGLPEPAKAKDLGLAPPDAHEGRTGTLPDGTKVVVKGGRLVAQ